LERIALDRTRDEALEMIRKVILKKDGEASTSSWNARFRTPRRGGESLKTVIIGIRTQFMDEK